MRRYTKPNKIKDSLPSILRDLELHGRATTSNKHASRKLAYTFKDAKKRGDINFFWKGNPRGGGGFTTIVLKPSVKLYRVGDRKVKLMYSHPEKRLTKMQF